MDKKLQGCKTEQNTIQKNDICEPSYPDVYINSPLPDSDCDDIPYRNFRVISPEPHNFDGDKECVGCEK